MTHVVVQDLAADARVARLACGALVRKVAVYARRLAVLLPTCMLVYSLRGSGAGGDPEPDPSDLEGGSAAWNAWSSAGRAASRCGGRLEADELGQVAPSGRGAGWSGSAPGRVSEGPLGLATLEPPGCAGGGARALLSAGQGQAGAALRYALVARIERTLECNLLVATDQHLVLCQARCSDSWLPLCAAHQGSEKAPYEADQSCDAYWCSGIVSLSAHSSARTHQPKLHVCGLSLSADKVAKAW